jgi:hypothetical protein
MREVEMNTQQKPLDLSIDEIRTVNMVFSQPIPLMARPVACCTSTVAVPEDPDNAPQEWGTNEGLRQS